MKPSINQILVGRVSLESEPNLVPAMESLIDMAILTDARITLEGFINQFELSDGNLVDVMIVDGAYKQWLADEEAMLMEDFRCTISTSGRYGAPSPVITVNVNEPNEKWEIGEFYIEQRGTGISFVNIGFVPEPPAEETPAEQPRRTGSWQEKGNYVEFRESDFDPLHLEHFLRMYDEAVSEVLHMSIPLDTTREVKHFQNGQVVYNLSEPHRMKAAGMVLAQGLNVITAQGDLTDLRLMNLTSRVSSLVFSGFYGNEVEWLEAHSKEGRDRARDEFREREWGGATDEQVLYIEDMLSRLRNLG